MEIKKNLEIKWDKVLLVWFWWFKNMWDELILLWNIKLLQKQWKKIFVVSQDNERLKNFLSKEIDRSNITFVDELPRWFRSTIKYLKRNWLKQLKLFFKIDTVILWWWEILTEESSHSYYYRFWSIRPSLFFKKNLYIMWWVQIPQKKLNKKLFNYTLKRTTRIFCRDFDWVETLKSYWFENVEFFMDTSYFVRDDWKKYYHTPKEKYIIININSKWEKFIPLLKKELQNYSPDFSIYFVPVCAGRTDDDTKYFTILQKDIPSLKKLEWTNDFESFLNFLWWAEKVMGTRLHLFLISSFIWVETKVFPYQKKIIKMQNVLEKIK